MRERGLTGDALARLADVHPSHISRALREADYKAIGPALATRIALALGLPCDYFPEAREGAVMEHLRRDAELRDRVHDELFPAQTRGAAYGEIFELGASE
jgi:transcriptional regulator with XRE-family HTH domain